MKKKWNKPAQFKRALAILFTAVLIFQAVPMQSAISMTANAEETTEGTQEDKKENSQNSGEENSKEKSNSGEDKKESDQQDTSKEGDSDSSKDGDSSSGKENTGDTNSGNGKDGENSASEESGKDNSSTKGTGNENSSGDSSSDSTEGSSNTNTSGDEDKKDGENAGGSNSGQEGTAGGSGDSTGTGGTSGEGGNTDTSGNGGSNDSSGKTGTGTDGQTPSGDNGNMNTDGGTTGDKQDEQNPSDEETKEVTISYKGCRLDGSGDYTIKKEIHSNKSSVEFKFEVGGPEDTALQYQLVSDGDEKKDDGWKAADDNNETFTISSSESYDTPKSLYVRAYSKTLDKRKEYDNDGKAISLDFDLAEPELKVVKVDPETTDESIVTRENVTYTVSATDNKDYTVYKCALSSNAGEPSNDVSNELWKKAGTKADANADNNIEVTFDEEGNYNVYFIAVDEAGNTSEVVKAQSHLIDKTEPTIEVPEDQSSEAAKSLRNHTLRVTFTDSQENGERSGLKSFSYLFEDNEENKIEELSKEDVSITPGLDGSYTWTFDDSGYKKDTLHGKYKLTITVKDSAGNDNTKDIAFNYDNEGPEITIKSNNETTDANGNLYLNEKMEFTVTITDPDAEESSSSKLEYAAYICKKGAEEADYKWINNSAKDTYIPYNSETVNLNKDNLDNSGIIFTDRETYEIKVFAKDGVGNPQEKAGEISFVYYQKDKATGTITLDEKDAKSVSNADNSTIYYDKAVDLTYEAEHGGTYTAAYEKNGNQVLADTSLEEPYQVTLEDRGENETEHPVYSKFNIEGSDYAGTDITLTDKPSGNIVIDTKGPEVSWSVEDLSFGREEGLSYNITVDDHNGSGINDAELYYYIGDQKATEESVGEGDDVSWTSIKQEGGTLNGTSLTFTLSDKKGKLFIKACDLLGNKTVKLVNVVVVEKQDPQIDVKVKNDKGEDVLNFTSTQTDKNSSSDNQVKAEDYYNSLDVNLTITEQPEDEGGKGYSGISSVSWAMVLDSPDASPENANRIILKKLDSPNTLEDLQSKEEYKSLENLTIPSEELRKIVEEQGKSGQYNLYIWANDFCGNGQVPVVIPLLFDITPPTITVEMSGGVEHLLNGENQIFYNKTHGKLTICAKDDCSAPLESFSVTLKGEGTAKEVSLPNEEIPFDNNTSSITINDLSKYFEEEKITITVKSSDTVGNESTVISKDGTKGVVLEKDGKSASFILDAKAPEVTIKYIPTTKTYVYTDENGKPCAYTNSDVNAELTVVDGYPDNQKLFMHKKKDGVSDAKSWDTGTPYSVPLPKIEEKEILYTLSAYGTDIVGNPATVKEILDETNLDKDFQNSNDLPTIEDLKKIEANGTKNCDQGYVPIYSFMIDTCSPKINLIYDVDTSVNENQKAFVYDDEKYVDNDLVAYVSGKINVEANITENNFDPNRMYYVNPGQTGGIEWSKNGKDNSTQIKFDEVASEGIYVFEVYGTDKAGNYALVNESFLDESKLFKIKENISLSAKDRAVGKQNYRPYYAIIIDQTSPVVNAINTDVSSKYYDDDKTFYYNSSNGITTTYSIQEDYYDANRISASYKLDDSEVSLDSQKTDNNSYSITFTKDGKYTDVILCGTDRAGNHVVLDPNYKPSQDPSQDAAETKTNEKPDSYGMTDTFVELSYPRILDRVSPVATIEHTIPDNTTGYLYPEKENDSTATMYSNHAVTTKIQVSDKYGEEGSEKDVLLDGEKLSVKKYFRKADEKSATPDALNWLKGPGNTDPLKTETTTTKEGHYTFSISGTDRAGNQVVVSESLITNDKASATVDTSKCDATPGTDIPTTENNPYKSFYALVYDCTAPVYRLTINNPSNLEESFDEKTSIAYYGKSVSAINAKYVVTDYNFDDTRIQAGITSESASGVNNMDSLSPSWTTPDIKASAKEDNGLTAATFNLTVSVDGQHEGMHRFEIGGCDKAGNFLVQSSEQVTVDNSTKRADLAAKTVAQDASEGKFWTQRKAVDVSAPTGALKVRSSKDSNNYYHYKFDPGQNTPVMYEPFRKETSAYVIVESDDCSPTIVQYNLRSQDGSKDTEYKKKNPLVSAGNNGYKNDNTRDVTVNGEQAFYLENIIIKDRAGNVRANDSKSKYTMARSNNVYLDVTTPLVSDIKDAESPQVKIVASNSFTRHEADGERYIYKPDGSALDLKVSINDPGGKERSSGLQKVEVEVKVGGKVVTEKVSLGKIPYTYKKGSSDSHAPLVYDINDASISIPTGSFAESNDITITVTAWDNSGNKSTPSKDGGLLNLGIDTTAPTAIVTYQDTVQPQHDKYFKADRVVEIAIYDRNVDNGKINISTNTNVPGSFTAPHENKTTDGGDDGNKDKWTKTLHYDVDGDYTLQLSGTDALGNKLTDIKWNGPAPNEFTVDKTQPVIRINLPTEVNSQDGIKYYDNAATASIEIQEHNFFEETDPSLLNVTIEPTNHSGAEAPASPGRSAFSNSGTDMHVSTVDCTQDGDYEVTASYTDMAGNPAVVQGGEGKKSDQEAWSGKFVVDTVVPTLKMDPETFNVDKATGNPLKDPADQIYTRKDFAPRVIINDINYDEVNSKFDVKAYGANVRNEDLTEKAGDVSKGEYNIQFKNFEMVRDMDGVYKVTAIATDLAKHQAKLDFLFSVNRFGSTYVYADEATESKVTGYYINDTREPLRILELSPVELKTHTAELFKDHNRNTLAEDTQYTFNPAKGSTSIGTNSEGHRVYEYTISPEVFEEEGVYDFILSSTDAAGNENSTTMFRDGSVKDSEIEQVRFPIEFQVDKTVPVNRLTGVENDKEQFNTDQLEIMVYPEDYQTDIKDVEIKIWDGNRNGTNAIEDKAKYLHYRNIGEEEDVQKLAQENVYPIQDAKAGIPVTLEDKGSWQLLEVITTDLAGNKSTDYRTEDLEVNIMESRRPFLVTTNPIIQFYNFKPALYGTIGGVALLLFLLFFWKRRKEEKTGGKAA